MVSKDENSEIEGENRVNIPKNMKNSRDKSKINPPTLYPVIGFQTPNSPGMNITQYVFHNGNPACKLYTRCAIVAIGLVGVCVSYLPKASRL